ncbi:hypothetical protein IV203_032280 [Nitzschia inconspicua]|uniref:Uncharacterized protein n=1 Tax=Nitzschia inconspicua TaxID=303405 RepID=A0A9K3KJ88_9STRA|nr:hypothetical protein IV203_032280 [Nitzschia inconspicua]
MLSVHHDGVTSIVSAQSHCPHARCRRKDHLQGPNKRSKPSVSADANQILECRRELPELPQINQVHIINMETKESERLPVPTTASDQPTWFFTSGRLPFMMYPLPTRQGFFGRTLIDVNVNKKDDVRILNIAEPTIHGYFQTNKGGTLSFTFENPFYKGDYGSTPTDRQTNSETLDYQ